MRVIRKRRAPRWSQEYLLRVARKRAILKGHKPGAWSFWPNSEDGICYCKKCQMPFGILAKHSDIQTAITGTALYYDCPKRPWWGAKTKTKKKGNTK